MLVKILVANWLSFLNFSKYYGLFDVVLSFIIIINMKFILFATFNYDFL